MRSGAFARHKKQRICFFAHTLALGPLSLQCKSLQEPTNCATRLGRGSAEQPAGEAETGRSRMLKHMSRERSTPLFSLQVSNLRSTSGWSESFNNCCSFVRVIAFGI